MDHGLEAAGLDPALGLLIDQGPGREVMGNEPPGSSGADHPARGIEDLTQVMPALASIQREKREVGRNKGPFLITDIGRVGGPGFHPRNTLPSQHSS